MKEIMIILIPFIIAGAFALINTNKTAQIVMHILVYIAEAVYAEQGKGQTKKEFVVHILMHIPILKTIDPEIIDTIIESIVINMNNKKGGSEK